MTASAHYGSRLAYGVTIFTGAFLLFQVQPLVGKYILPWFGGGTGVWTTCMLFFQLLLLGGYGYAHLLTRRLAPRWQVIVHLLLLVTALALLPIIPSEAWKPSGMGDPTTRILVLLAGTLGLPYFVLSATGPLMQHWFARTHPGVSPYRLYALSNVGSLLALVSYPVFFETHFTRRFQASMWGWGLAAFALFCGGCAVALWRTPSAAAPLGATPSDRAAPEVAPPTAWQRVLWVLLPACASLLLLATTHKVCEDVTVVPFLWVLPLVLYLLSFVICFDHPRWYVRGLFALGLVAILGTTYGALFAGVGVTMWQQVALFCAALFFGCMLCHGEVYRLRPDPRHLTEFYLMLAAGGALGGLLVAVVAPLLLTDFYELHAGYVLCLVLLLAASARERKPLELWRWPAGLGLSACALAVAGVISLQVRAATSTLDRARNFYGVLKVSQRFKADPDQHFVELTHGHIVHGVQLVEGPRTAWPTAYYATNSGVGLAFGALPPTPRRVGLVGFGAGTLLAYGRAGDYFHAYEINPAVQRMARTWFSFLQDCPARVEMTLGDGRLSLEREPPQHFDLLVLDAFSGDAIPMHLLTREAFEVYERHLNPGGVIAVHISNPYIDLEPVVLNLAHHFGYESRLIEANQIPAAAWMSYSKWALLTRNVQFANAPAIRQAAIAPKRDPPLIPLWTDDFASLFQVLRR